MSIRGDSILQRYPNVAGQVRDIHIPGKQDEVNSFAACVQAALCRWGRQVAYDRVAGLAGVSFCPGWRTGDTCPFWWTERSNDERLDFMGHALGFTAEASPQETDGIESLAFRCRARLAQRNGALILCNTQPCWSLVTGWHDDPECMTLAAPGNMADECRMTPETRIYILRQDERALSRCEALRAALQFGAEVASGRYRTNDLEYGGRLYDAWAGRLDDDLFCPRCGTGGWRCIEGAATRVRAGQIAASRFLAWAARVLPEAESHGVGLLADTYALMAQKLEPYGRGSDAEHMWRDPGQRARYRDDVSRVRELHHAAAGCLDSLSQLL